MLQAFGQVVDQGPDRGRDEALGRVDGEDSAGLHAMAGYGDEPPRCEPGGGGEVVQEMVIAVDPEEVPLLTEALEVAARGVVQELVAR